MLPGTGTVIGLVDPLAEFIQLVGDKLNVSCNTNPDVSGVQETVACPGPAGTIVSTGAPGVWIA